MRRSTLGVVAGSAVALVFTAGCLNPLRQYGEENPQPTAPVTAFDGFVTARLAGHSPMAQVKKQAVSGTIDLKKAMKLVNDGWRAYLDSLHDARLTRHPVLIEGRELNGNGYADICWQGENHRFPEPRFPLNCINAKSGGERTALAVWPQGYTHKVQAFANAHTGRDGWVLASLLAGLSYADHARAEMRELKFAWPDGRPFDYCVTGMSLRAVFPANQKEWLHANLPAIVAALDRLVSPPDDPDARAVMLARGYTLGKLDICLG